MLTWRLENFAHLFTLPSSSLFYSPDPPTSSPTADRLPDICEDYTFTVEIARRELQNEGGLCQPNVVTVANENGLSVFTQLVEQAGLADIFLCPGPFTAWVPSNAAFEALDPALVEYLLAAENVEDLREILLYHLIPGAVLTTEFQPGPIETIQGENVIVGIDPVTINSAFVTEADIAACNGIIDVIDQVLFPPSFGKMF